MLNIASRTASAVAQSMKRLAAGMATAVPRIGDTKVEMSLLEKGKYINYQRIEDNLAIVRSRLVLFSFILLEAFCTEVLPFRRKILMACCLTVQVEPTINIVREDFVRTSG